MMTKRRGRPAQGSSALSSETILDRAKQLLLEQGKIPSVRAIASSLDVDAMAIYNYYKNKNSLLEAIASSLIDEIYQPQTSADWQAELQQLALSYLKLLRKYPGLLNTLLTMSGNGPAVIFSQRFDRVLAGLPLTNDVKQQTLHLLVDYLHGFSLACECANENIGPDINEIKGPINLIITAVESNL